MNGMPPMEMMLFTPNYTADIGLDVEEFLNCLVSGFNELKHTTTIHCSFHTAYHRGLNIVYLFFDQRPGISAEGCDFFFILSSEGVLLSGVIQDREYINHLRPWVRTLIENKVIIQGVPATRGEIHLSILTKSHEYQNAWH